MEKFLELKTTEEANGVITELHVLVNVENIAYVKQKLDGMKGCLIYTCGSTIPLEVEEQYEDIAHDLGLRKD